MIIFEFLARLVAVLRAAATPAQIGAGFALGMVIGLVPSLPLTFAGALALIVLNVNLTAAFLAMALFGALAWLGDPLFHSLGYFLLVDLSSLRTLWVQLYNTPFIPYTGFNNTVVLGSLLTGLILAVPAFVLAKRGVIVYRRDYDEKVVNLKVIRYLRTTIIYRWYVKLTRLGEKLL